MIGYLDAGSGSMIVGAVAAGAAGAVVTVRAGLSRLRRGGRATSSDAVAEPATPADQGHDDPAPDPASP